MVSVRSAQFMPISSTSNFTKIGSRLQFLYGWLILNLYTHYIHFCQFCNKILCENQIWTRFVERCTQTLAKISKKGVGSKNISIWVTLFVNSTFKNYVVVFQRFNVILLKLFIILLVRPFIQIIFHNNTNKIAYNLMENYCYYIIWNVHVILA